MRIRKFEEIESWKKSRELTSKIYWTTSKGKFTKDYGLRDQIQRAAVSIMANIAEGFSSGSSKSFLVFLRYSYRSASEVQSLLYIAHDIGYIDEIEFETIYNETDFIKRLINEFIQYLKKIPSKEPIDKFIKN
jgi:four helix bundle protein